MDCEPHRKAALLEVIPNASSCIVFFPKMIAPSFSNAATIAEFFFGFFPTNAGVHAVVA